MLKKCSHSRVKIKNSVQRNCKVNIIKISTTDVTTKQCFVNVVNNCDSNSESNSSNMYLHEYDLKIINIEKSLNFVEFSMFIKANFLKGNMFLYCIYIYIYVYIQTR